MTNSSVFSEPPQVVINSLIDYKKLEQQEYIDIWNSWFFSFRHRMWNRSRRVKFSCVWKT